MTDKKTEVLSDNPNTPTPEPRQTQSARDRQYRAGLRKGEPDWSRACATCGMEPTVFTEENDCHPMCGPCFFGEAETINGNW